METDEYMYDADYLSAPTPLPSFPHCDYSEWTPSFSIIPAVYLLAFFIGCLGNGLVLWAYLDRPDGRKKSTIGDQSRISKLCCFSICKEEINSEIPQNRESSRSSSRPMSQTSTASYPPSVPRPTRSLTESLIASLALADLCFLVTLPLWAVYTAMGYHWPFGQPLCQMSSFLTALNMYASVFSLSMLSVERYWVLTGRRHSGHHHRKFPTRAILIITGVWILSCILALPGLLLRSVHEIETITDDWDSETAHPTSPGSFFLSCQMDYSMLIGDDLSEPEREHAEMWWAAILSLKSTLIGFLLPLIILLICYCSLAKLLNKHFGRGPRPDRKRQRRLLRVIVTLVMAFFLCWLPLHVNKTLAVLLGFGYIPYSCTLDRILLSVQPYVTCIAYLNSCLNPLLYAACDPAFRKRCRGALLFLCNIRKRDEKSAIEKEEVDEGKEEKTLETADRTEEDRLG
ncbi:apelin receptor 2 [Boleophthalmus pectinirostris]|uniref:apelin receptor 2 n=1 Tax=Boleophthalmus pectinirostris TaxID=150288 RepID=UPI000A1C3C26|nr:apelin receptor 2 [Boleophthalmus pectinirostris]